MGQTKSQLPPVEKLDNSIGDYLDLLSLRETSTSLSQLRFIALHGEDDIPDGRKPGNINYPAITRTYLNKDQWSGFLSRAAEGNQLEMNFRSSNCESSSMNHLGL